MAQLHLIRVHLFSGNCNFNTGSLELIKFQLQLGPPSMLEPSLQIVVESYRILVDSMPDCAFYILNQEGIVFQWNRGSHTMMGYSTEEMVGQHFSILYPEEERLNGAPDRDIEAAKRNKRYEKEGWCVRKDGTFFWARTTIILLQDENSNLIGFGIVTHDLSGKAVSVDAVETLNMKLHARLQMTQKKILDYKHALDESAIVAITDHKGIITHVNQNFCDISKYTKEELLGQDHRIINSGYHSKEFIRNLWKTIASGRVWRGELKNKAKDGSYYWVDTTIVPFLNEKGKPTQYLAIRSDITQRKKAEEQLQKINEELEVKVKERTWELTQALEREKELSEMKSRFVSLASHEFRTPLSAILSSTALLEYYNQPEQAEKRSKHIGRIKSSIQNLTSILDDFLSLEKLEQGSVAVNPENFNLKEFVADVLEEIEGLVKKKSQSVHFVYKGRTTVCQDKKIIRNILLNLLSNAVKYSPENGHIFVGVEANDAVLLSIRDEGIGIPLAAQKHLFSKFFRADNAVTIQGTGLGLHIVHRYVDLIEGAITFESVEKKGAIFKVQFPAIIKSSSQQV